MSCLLRRVVLQTFMKLAHRAVPNECPTSAMYDRSMSQLVASASSCKRAISYVNTYLDSRMCWQWADIVYIVSGKKSLRYFRHIFDKLKPIFIFFGRSCPEYSLYLTVEIFSLYIGMSLRRADVIMTSSKMPLLMNPR